MTIEQRTRRPRGFDQRDWQDHSAKPQSREEHLVETAREDDPARRIEPLHGCQRSADETKLAVVIVFKNPRPRLPRPLNQLQPAFQRQGHAQRKLICRCDVGHARL